MTVASIGLADERVAGVLGGWIRGPGRCDVVEWEFAQFAAAERLADGTVEASLTPALGVRDASQLGSWQWPKRAGNDRELADLARDQRIVVALPSRLGILRPPFRRPGPTVGWLCRCAEQVAHVPD